MYGTNFVVVNEHTFNDEWRLLEINIISPEETNSTH